MKIAVVARKIARGDGQGRINYEIVRHAVRNGHSVTVLTEFAEPDLMESGVTWIPINPSIPRPEIFATGTFPAIADRHLKQIAGSHDVIVGNGFTPRHPHAVNLAQFVHGTWLKSPMHVSRQTSGPYAWYQWLYTRMNARWELESFAASQIVVAPSKLTRDELLRIGVPEKKIRVIPNGVDLEEFRPGVESPEALGLPKAKPLAVFAGDIRTTRKNLDGVLRALPRVPALHLAVIGKLAKSPFPRLAQELGVADRVHFLDFRKDTACIMRASDLFVFPSRYDTFGLVVLEAMATGLPVVTSATAGSSELMTDACGVVLADPEDVDGLADAMQRFVNDEAARITAGTEGRAVAERYGWASMAEQYLRLCEEARRSPRN